MLKLDRISTQAVSVENYEIRFFRSNYTHILEYLCRFSFLTILTYIRIILWAVIRWCKVLKMNNPCMLWLETEIALVHHILYRSYCVFMPRVLWPRSFWIFTIDELKNFVANNLPQVGVLVTYWDPCIIG